MGSAGSKPARRLGSQLRSKPAAPSTQSTQPPPPGGPAGAPRAQAPPTPPPPPPQEAAQAARGAQGVDTASSTKDRKIMQDAMDPDFLKNLASLGPVRTRKPMDEFDTADPMLNILDVRMRQERSERKPKDLFATAEQPSPGLTSSELVRLLQEYQTSPTPQHLERLAVEYDTDAKLLEGIAKWVRLPERQPMQVPEEK